MRHAMNARVQVTDHDDQPEYNGMHGRVKSVREKAYTIILDNGEDLIAWDHEVKAEDKSAMKHDVRTRVQIIAHKEMPFLNGRCGYIISLGHNTYMVRLDRDTQNTVCFEEEVQLEKKRLTSPMENYGRMLLPMLHGSNDAPKMVYHSSTTGSVYMMNKMMNNARYFEVCVVRMLWDRDLQDRNLNKLQTEVFRLKNPMSGMTETVAIFTAFITAHVNGIPSFYEKMLWQED